MVMLVKEAALDKKAEDLVILDVSSLTSIAHYFVITHGNSTPHVKAIAKNMMEQLKAAKVSLFHKEGLDSGTWVLLDFGAVIAHIFYRETREFYGLERLWGEAKQIQ